MPPGRTRKYHSEDECMAARRSTKLVWYHRCVSRTSSAAEHRCITIVSNIFASRNAPAIANRRRRRLGQTECEEDTDRGEGLGETSLLEDVTPPGREPSEGVVRSIVNGEVPSPGAAIREHIYNAIDSVPRGSNIEHRVVSGREHSMGSIVVRGANSCTTTSPSLRRTFRLRI